MRSSCAVLTALGLALTACASPLDAPPTGRLVLVPVFGAGAASSVILTLDSVAVEVRRDRSILVADGQRIDSNQSTVTLDLRVPLADVVDTVDVDLNLMAGGVSLFRGIAPAEVRAGGSTTPAPIPLTYIGSDTIVVAITITQRDPFVALTGTLQFDVSAFAIQGLPVSPVFVSWGTLPAGGTAPLTMQLSRTGLLQAASNRSQVYVKATAGNGVSDSVLVTFYSPLPLSGLTQAWDHGCGLASGGQTYCWGANYVGQLGDGSTTDRLTPTAVTGGLSFTSLTAGGEHTCGLSGGQAWCWGDNVYGELGDASNTDRPLPTAVAGALTFASLSAGTFHTCGLTAAGQAWCWGDNAGGALGDSTRTSRNTPVPVAGGHTFTSLTAGEAHTCGIDVGGQAWCWGVDSTGALGNGGFLTRFFPVAVSGGLAFTSLSTGRAHTCGVASGGVAYCWGDGTLGAVGDSAQAIRGTPVAVSGGLTFSQVLAGGAHTCGLTSTGAAYCWGWNAYGQVGDSSTTDRLAPVPVAGGLSFSSHSVGAMQSCGVSGGLAYCWGYNQLGELGDGSQVNRSVPVAVVNP